MYNQRDIALIPIPFTDLSSIKKRPVLILSSDSYNEKRSDVIIAAITSNIKDDPYGIFIKNEDLFEGELIKPSVVRADKIYTLSKTIIIKKFGALKKEKFTAVSEKLLNIFKTEHEPSGIRL